MNKLFATVTAPVPRPAPVAAPPAAAPAAADRVFVRDLVLDASVGVYAHERDRPQRIRLGLDLALASPGVGGEDGVAAIRAVLDQGHVTLIETLAERIAARCLEDARVAAATVRVEKLDVFPDAVVGVEITRARG